jgi:hypothetical protein
MQKLSQLSDDIQTKEDGKRLEECHFKWDWDLKAEFPIKFNLQKKGRLRTMETSVKYPCSCCF